MGAIEFYIEQLRLLWLQFVPLRLIKTLRDGKITDEQALQKLNMYNNTQKIFNFWSIKIEPRRLHIYLSRVMEYMKKFGIEIPEVNKIVQDFLESGELPKY